jgi:hypothetical protein
MDLAEVIGNEMDQTQNAKVKEHYSNLGVLEYAGKLEMGHESDEVGT